jgi:hypothetical protein
MVGTQNFLLKIRYICPGQSIIVICKSKYSRRSRREETSALAGLSGQLHAPATLPIEKQPSEPIG